MFNYETSHGRGDAIRSATELVVHAFPGESNNMARSLRIGFALESAKTETKVILTGFLRDLLKKNLITVRKAEESFGPIITSLHFRCEEIDLCYGKSFKELTFATAKENADVISIKLAEIAEDLKTVRKLSPQDQEEFMTWARNWQEIADTFLPSNNPLTVNLKHAIEIA